MRFHSKAEAERWKGLKLLERVGRISELKRQVVFPLVINGRAVLLRSKGYPNGRKAKYTADFTYMEMGILVAEDSKGYDQPESRFRRAVAEAVYHMQIRITGKK